MEKRVKVLKLTPHDNVGTALQDLKKGDTFQIILFRAPAFPFGRMYP